MKTMKQKLPPGGDSGEQPPCQSSVGRGASKPWGLHREKQRRGHAWPAPKDCVVGKYEIKLHFDRRPLPARCLTSSLTAFVLQALFTTEKGKNRIGRPGSAQRKSE